MALRLRFAIGSLDYLQSLAPKVKQDIRAALRLLEEDARHDKLNLKLLRVKGTLRIFRARIGRYRVVFSPRSDHTYVWRIQHRSEGYGWLERLDPE